MVNASKSNQDSGGDKYQFDSYKLNNKNKVVVDNYLDEELDSEAPGLYVNSEH
ncbi:hypothetical protein RO3G_02501 [Rhizopus delemar RA 99-880]|uniref:Uncharacterized protein n=1 Tax=Rhizopus delemar (strain RA 99-880 / ATCC MYA-4621 / FGSC 9543 / NRRL 43880) TaxID=246409 RepID=I1BNL7_RHIO9|nr:hypothetical protein RO3G_02501 [Rhizopus delemar RA 99-880]|eukprot:EIE77797.1 hypothetical protein RO3G_02501 [Rhizopus delemar RA 99-880]